MFNLYLPIHLVESFYKIDNVVKEKNLLASNKETQGFEKSEKYTIPPKERWGF